MIGQLPQSVTVNGTDYAVRTDYRDILRILEAYNDPNLEDREKVYICLVIFYKDFADVMPPDDYESALIEAMRFIDMGNENDNSKKKDLCHSWSPVFNS